MLHLKHPNVLYHSNDSTFHVYKVHDIVQEAVIETIPKKNKCKKAKRLSEEALHIAEKRRDAKGKGEKERYTHLNAEFQTTARRAKKAFLSDQGKETGKQ